MLYHGSVPLHDALRNLRGLRVLSEGLVQSCLGTDLAGRIPVDKLTGLARRRDGRIWRNLSRCA